MKHVILTSVNSRNSFYSLYHYILKETRTRSAAAAAAQQMYSAYGAYDPAMYAAAIQQYYQQYGWYYQQQQQYAPIGAQQTSVGIGALSLPPQAGAPLLPNAPTALTPVPQLANQFQNQLQLSSATNTASHFPDNVSSMSSASMRPASRVEPERFAASTPQSMQQAPPFFAQSAAAAGANNFSLSQVPAQTASGAVSSVFAPGVANAQAANAPQQTLERGAAPGGDAESSAESELQAAAKRAVAGTGEAAERYTPLKFTRSHVSARFWQSVVPQLVLVNSQGSPYASNAQQVSVLDSRRFLQKLVVPEKRSNMQPAQLSARRLVGHMAVGPFAFFGRMLKNEVLFTLKDMRKFYQSVTFFDHDSALLICSLLEFLLKKSGFVTNAEIAAFLLENDTDSQFTLRSATNASATTAAARSGASSSGVQRVDPQLAAIAASGTGPQSSALLERPLDVLRLASPMALGGSGGSGGGDAELELPLGAAAGEADTLIDDEHSILMFPVGHEGDVGQSLRARIQALRKHKHLVKYRELLISGSFAVRWRFFLLTKPIYYIPNRPTRNNNKPVQTEQTIRLYTHTVLYCMYICLASQ